MHLLKTEFCYDKTNILNKNGKEIYDSAINYLIENYGISVSGPRTTRINHTLCLGKTVGFEVFPKSKRSRIIEICSQKEGEIYKSNLEERSIFITTPLIPSIGIQFYFSIYYKNQKNKK